MKATIDVPVYQEGDEMDYNEKFISYATGKPVEDYEGPFKIGDALWVRVRCGVGGINRRRR